ncbi:MAG: hypothetical protein R3B99_21755 [Polyangiales bacterium]
MAVGAEVAVGAELPPPSALITRLSGLAASYMPWPELPPQVRSVREGAVAVLAHREDRTERVAAAGRLHRVHRGVVEHAVLVQADLARVVRERNVDEAVDRVVLSRSSGRFSSITPIFIVAVKSARSTSSFDVKPPMLLVYSPRAAPTVVPASPSAVAFGATSSLSSESSIQRPVPGAAFVGRALVAARSRPDALSRPAKCAT